MKQQPSRGLTRSAAAGTLSVGSTMMNEQREAARHRWASWRLESSTNFPMIRLTEEHEAEAQTYVDD